MATPKHLVHLIDDDPEVLKAVAFMLRAAGYRVAPYDSGLSFLDSLGNRIEGCIVTDVRMPDQNGIELTAQLQGLGFEVPVIVMSGHGDLALAREAVRAGALDFIEKPFDDEVLLDCLARAFANPALPA
jgi:two-component system response regulator FixJ